LFKNNRKETENHPDYTGSITLPNGTEHFLSAWLKTAKSGKKYMSLSIGKAKDQANQNKSNNSQQQDDALADFDDEVPF
jgi:uncharacterized protein (DUF736 family)